MFQSDHSPDISDGSDLLSELGVDRHTLREIVEDERAIRCPDRGAVYPERSFASLNPDPASGHALHEAAPAEPRDPASPFPRSD